MPTVQRYPCVRVKQEEGSKDILLFAASASEIDAWVGIPQRLNLEGNETVGFQRTVSSTREAALRKFFSEDRNVMQNPLLCAIRQAPGEHVTFEPATEENDIGHVSISLEPLGSYSFLELLRAARLYLESRSLGLTNRPIPSELVVEIQGTLDPQSLIVDEGNAGDDEIGEESEGEDFDESELDEPAEEALFDESQITEFWDQLRAREEVAARLEASTEIDDMQGFSRRMLESYLRPVILVDGQHRLRGAVLAAEDEIDSGPEAHALIAEGKSPDEARAILMPEKVRHLPVSLLMDDSPAEHVFQYVLVNQKATPVPRALLGTIISTSLGADELATIADRLEDAKIPLEGSRIVSMLSKASDSPFMNLVAKGIEGDGAYKLQWSVLSSLADMFRYLKGGRFYHAPMDHADVWRKHHLEASGIVADWQARDFPSPFDYWKDLSGPWMLVFKAFWSATRDALASENEESHNYWGNTRDSNIFNKPSLHILSADFFSYLREKKARIDAVDQIPGYVTDWLEYVSPQYFARDWRLEGVKKDSVGTRRQWSKLWTNYRQQGSLPAPGEFAKIYRA